MDSILRTIEIKFAIILNLDEMFKLSVFVSSKTYIKTKRKFE